jgi:hypothetical protein
MSNQKQAQVSSPLTPGYKIAAEMIGGVQADSEASITEPLFQAGGDLIDTLYLA